MRPSVPQVHIEMMGVVVILLTVLIEVGTHKLDHITFHFEHIFEMVQRVYKELMLLGIISFMLFLVESANLRTMARSYQASAKSSSR